MIKFSLLSLNEMRMEYLHKCAFSFLFSHSESTFFLPNIECTLNVKKFSQLCNFHKRISLNYLETMQKNYF